MDNVAVTGLGAITSIGSDVESYVQGLTAGRFTIVPAPWAKPDEGRFAWVSSIAEFDPAEWMSDQVVAGTGAFAQYAIAAAVQAVDNHGAELDTRRTGVVLGSSMAGARELLDAQRLLSEHGPSAVPKKLNIQAWANMAGGQIAMRWGLHGPLLTICTACASSLDAIGQAARLIEAGAADVVITGGSEAGLSDALYYSQLAYGMSQPIDRNDMASLPFDVKRAGIVEGEGAGVVVLERADRARERGAAIFGYVNGYGSLADSYHPSSPDPTGRWELEAMRLAQDDAGAKATGEIDLVVAHGTGTPVGDSAEIQAINGAFTDRIDDVVVTSVKGNIGHTGAAAGVLSVIAALNAGATSLVPPVANTDEVDPAAKFQVVTGTARSMKVRAAQVNGFGFGGQNASLVISCAP